VLAAFGAAIVSSPLPAAERPAVTAPRQTSGDRAVEPAWEQRLTITVGTRDADIVGSDQRAIQGAIDQLARLGGGTVHVKAGEYRLRNAVLLQSGVRLVGDGAGTVLVKEPSSTTPLEADSDWYDQEITLRDATGFRVGDGVCLRAKDPHAGREVVLKRTLTASSGSRFKLDRPLRENVWQMHDATCSTLFALLAGDHVEDVRIENLVLDGNRDRNAELDGNHAGCIFLQDCSRVEIRGVTARNYRGDGISWQICHDVVVENCLVENNKNLGLHPGSGSQRPIIRGNTIRGCDIGIFFCWGVKYGLAEDNLIEGNSIGISIGHRDTDNLVVGNTIRRSAAHGLLFRPERGPTFAGHRNRIERNTFVDNGPNEGFVVDVQGGTQDIELRDNVFTETRQGIATRSVRAGPETRNVTVAGSRLEGVAPLQVTAPAAAP
jgi:nitrous oxidase accessory protein NosD